MSEGSGTEIDISEEVEVKTSHFQAEANHGSPAASSTVVKDCKEVHREKAKLCFICGKSYKYRQSLRLHVRAVHEKGFQCNVCEKMMTSKQHYESHMNGHAQKKPVVCGNCKKTYQSKSSLYSHACSSKMPTFKCNECNKLCFTSRALKQHNIFFTKNGLLTLF